MSPVGAMMVDVPLQAPVAGPLIGRADELAQLAGLTGVDVNEPQTGAVLLSGDAGVGKTRLIHELRGLAEEAGWRVLVGHCVDFGESALPYLPVGEMFSRLEAEAPALADAVAQAHPPLTRLMSGRPAPVESDTDRTDDTDRADSADRSDSAGGADGGRLVVDRAALFEAVHAAVAQLAGDAPLLLIVEDVHWADQSTRELLSFLFARGFPHGVTIVASYRSDDLHRRHPLRATAAEWARLRNVRRLPLGPLADADVRSLVRWLHSGPLREGEVHTVVERADGNAFFAEELVAATELGGGALPSDLAELLLVRLDQLDEDAQLAVRVASVGGRRVGHAVLSQVIDGDAETLDRALRTAVERNVLVPAGADGYTFRHALLAEAVYDDLLPGERVRLHAAYVRVLCADDQSGPAAEVARHARAAHDPETTIRMSIRAGDDAMSVGGPDEAARHYEVALELLADPAVAVTVDDKPVDVVALTVKAAEAVAAAGRPYRGVAIVQEQLRQHTVLSDTDRAHLLCALATHALQSQTDVDPLAVSTEALQLVPADPPSPLRARILGVLARANADRLRHDDAAVWAGEALSLAAEFDLRDVAADATTTLAQVEQLTGDPESSKRALTQILTDARASGDTAVELRALHNLGGLHFEEGGLTEALTVYRRATDRAREIGRPWAPYGVDARVLASLVAYQTGEWEVADALVDVSGQAPPGIAEAALTAAGMAVAAGRGDQRALDLLTPIRPWWRRDGLIAILSGGAAIDLYGDRGDIDAAGQVYDDTVASVAELWQQPDFQARIRLAALMLGQLAAQVPRSTTADRARLARRADELAETARRVAENSLRRVGRRGPEGDAWLARVRAEHLRLRWLADDQPGEDELLTGWQDAVAAFERYPHRFELARSRARLAAVLRATGQTAEARAVADAARATAQQLNARPLLTELRELGASRLARRDQASRFDDSLTPREREILLLVAQGRSNREIGGQLYISAKTVSVHVSNVLAKLGASGRTEAVAVARRRGLLTD
ncbi:MAG: helix-turn-helix transcriptional regulator [Nocardioidaceae bacterium]